jgi:hypothetical protein
MTRGRSSWTIVLAGLAILQSHNVVLVAEQPDIPSLARIRRALEQTPMKGLTLPPWRGEPNVGDFRVEVHEKKPDLETTILDTLDFTPGPILEAPALYPSTAPLFEVKIPMAESLAAKVRNARRARAERAAHTEALEALREFCATHVCSGQP